MYLSIYLCLYIMCVVVYCVCVFVCVCVFMNIMVCFWMSSTYNVSALVLVDYVRQVRTLYDVQCTYLCLYIYRCICNYIIKSKHKPWRYFWIMFLFMDNVLTYSLLYLNTRFGLPLYIGLLIFLQLTLHSNHCVIGVAKGMFQSINTPRRNKT